MVSEQGATKMRKRSMEDNGSVSKVILVNMKQTRDGECAPIRVSGVLQLFAKYGMIEKIITMAKKDRNMIQAMIQYHTTAMAEYAIQEAQGTQQGAFMVRMSFSDRQDLEIGQNNERMFDFLNPWLGEGPPATGQTYQKQPTSTQKSTKGIHPPAGPLWDGQTPTGTTSNGSPVLLVHHLRHDALSIDHVYNLFCNYGLVLKVKFMHNKDGILVEFADSQAAENAREALQGVVAVEGGEPMVIRTSKFQTITMAAVNGLDSKEYQTPKRAARVQKGVSLSEIVHVNFIPLEFMEHLQQMITQTTGNPQVAVCPMESRGDAFGMALVKLPDVPSAIKTVMEMSGMEIGGKRLKVSFTSSKV